MTIAIYFILYVIIVSVFAWFMEQKPLYDAVKRSGKWVFTSNLEEGSTIKIPIRCFEEILKSPTP